jgi:hypothetical protein
MTSLFIRLRYKGVPQVAPTHCDVTLGLLDTCKECKECLVLHAWSELLTGAHSAFVPLASFELGQRDLNPADQMKLMEALMAYKLSIKQLALGWSAVVARVMHRRSLVRACFAFVFAFAFHPPSLPIFARAAFLSCALAVCVQTCVAINCHIALRHCIFRHANRLSCPWRAQQHYHGKCHDVG